MTTLDAPSKNTRVFDPATSVAPCDAWSPLRFVSCRPMYADPIVTGAVLNALSSLMRTAVPPIATLATMRIVRFAIVVLATVSCDVLHATTHFGVWAWDFTESAAELSRTAMQAARTGIRIAGRGASREPGHAPATRQQGLAKRI